MFKKLKIFLTFTEEEVGSFLGQTENSDYPPEQSSASDAFQPSTQGQFSTASFFQEPAPANTSASTDPFQNVSHGPPPPDASSQPGSIPLMVPPQPPVSATFDMGPPSAPQNAPPVQPFVPAAASTPQQAPPAGGPPVGPPSGSGQGMYRLRDVKHRPMPHPVDASSLSSPGPPLMFPSSSPQAVPLESHHVPPAGLQHPHGVQSYDPARPPPTNEELSAVNIHPPLPGGPGIQSQYRPVLPHWFYCAMKGNTEDWLPFSTVDSSRLEESYLRGMQNKNEIILAMNGGRYDVNLRERTRHSIYWEEAPSKVRRCTWFFKSDGDNKFVPYDEELAATLEEEYKSAALQNLWNRRLELPEGEAVVMHNPNVIVHFRPGAKPREWGSADTQIRPRVVKRGVDDIDDIDFGEPDKIDHLVFVVHGIGPVCDLRFRSIVECVEDFRSISLRLMNSHFVQAVEDGRAARVEFLPVYWYEALHGDATGVDSKLKRITLPSILRLRRFTNDTLLDILFYSSPAYCQQIAEVVASEINRLYNLFKERNPSFNGQTSLIGHSLGSLIVFDLLSHQGSESEPVPKEEDKDKLAIPAEIAPTDSCNSSVSNLSISNLASEDELGEEKSLDLEGALEQLGMSDLMPKFEEERIDMESLMMCEDSDLKELGIPLGPRKKIRGFIKHQAEKSERRKQQAEELARLGAAKAAQEEITRSQLEQSASSVNGLTLVDGHAPPSVHVDYTLGTQGVGQPFVKYPQLSVQPVNFFALGSPIGMFLTVRGLDDVGEDYKLPECSSFFNIFHPFDPVAYRIEPLINTSLADVKPVLMPHHKGRKRFHLEIKDSLAHFGADLKKSFVDSMKKTWKTLHEFALAHTSGEEEVTPAATDAAMEAVAEKLSQEQLQQKQEDAQHMRVQKTMAEADLRLGNLNSGRRIDYVLQEAPFESFNEYLFALGSHTCYWYSEDTVLMVLKEIYNPLGIYPSSNQIKDSGPPTPSQT
ncbi:putative phospholipase DDHD2 [Apostichopus japonicus]|uniref:Putative phospholipase DDHD2 n=1 Tax=Stichopus japonicus TaxID=307972 RepID=A0A2G8JQH7_STIJA|nr:putative phospholipase DDHD2 [Apostichopus japonicus]